MSKTVTTTRTIATTSVEAEFEKALARTIKRNRELRDMIAAELIAERAKLDDPKDNDPIKVEQRIEHKQLVLDGITKALTA